MKRVVRSDECTPHDQQGEGREHRGDSCSHASTSRTGESFGFASGAGIGAPRRSGVPGFPLPPKPPHVAAERLGKQHERGDERGHVHGGRQHACGRHGQHDPLRRGDDLAPIAWRERLTQPRKRQPGRSERVARRADREHPRADRAGHVHAEDEDQERIDLSVEVRAQCVRRPCASGDPSVDRVQSQRDDRE